MPQYTFQCPCEECAHRFQVTLTFGQYEETKQEESGVLCDKCGETAKAVFDPGQFGFNLKEGESGGWASKSMKENALRKKRWEEMGRRQKEHIKPHGLVPNYGGQLHDRWSDVQDHVRSTHGNDVAKTYEPFVKKEKSKLCPV